MTGNPDGVGRCQLATVLGVSEGMISRAFELDLLPAAIVAARRGRAGTD